MCFCIKYREDECVNDFLTIFILIVNYVRLILNDYIENVKFFIQFHFVDNFVRNFIC